MPAKPGVGLKQFRSDGCLSYCVFDPKSARAAIIDPVVEEMDSYRSFLGEHGLKLDIALDTHTHADHFSATHLLARECRAEVGMSSRTGSGRPTRKLGGGDRIELGALVIQVLETPGHTPDSLCYLVSGLVFTGDSLFIGSSGRTDFPGSDPAQQWKSIHEVLGALPDGTVVYPGHDYNDRLFSTIGHERKTNAHWLIPSRDAFVVMKNAEGIQTAQKEIGERIEFNLAAAPTREISSGIGAATACGVASTEPDRVAAIGTEKYRAKIDEKAKGTLFVDVRDPDEFEAGHIPNTINIPLSELGLHLKTIQEARRVYVSCQGGGRSIAAVKTLNHLGLADVVNVSGGFAAWSQAGHPVAR